jgi:hypothetical protein
VLDRAFEHPLELEEQATMPFAGGIMQLGWQCGLVWGSTLAAGAQAYRLFGPGPQAETSAIIATQRLIDTFQALNDHVDCRKITNTDLRKPMQALWYFLVKGGFFSCLRRTTRYTPVALDKINTALSERQIEGPSSPVSCTAMLAQKMGASDQQTVMTAGLAGGIGLCGSACGALGVAIWIIGLKSLEEKGGKLTYKSPETQAVIDRFLNNTDQKFQCSEIVGRKFEDIDDHAGYLHDGGCSELIDALAAE